MSTIEYNFSSHLVQYLIFFQFVCCAAAKILAKQPELKADFSRATSAVSQAKQNKVARFLPNPEANWGPKAKHGRVAKQPDAGNTSEGVEKSASIDTAGEEEKNVE